MTVSKGSAGPARGAASAALAIVILAACGPTAQPPASSRPHTCTVEVELVDGGPGAQVTGRGFEPDQPATLTVRGEASEPMTFTQTTDPGLRTDIRGVVLFGLAADREDVGAATFDLAAGGCTATATLMILESMFPPACPADEPVESGGEASSAYEALILADDPIAYWRFEEATGPLAVAVRGSDAAIIGDVVLGQAGPIPGSRAIGLSGGFGRIDMVDVELTGDFTVEGWIYFCGDAIDANDALFGPFPNLNFSDGAPRLWDGEMDRVFAGRPVVHARWYHVALVRDGTTLLLYIDGREEGRGELTASLPIGALGDADIGTLAGQLDEVAIYDHALTQEQLAARFAAAS